MKRFLLFALASGLALSSCAGIDQNRLAAEKAATDPESGGIDRIQAAKIFTLNDLKQASKMAHEADDKIAYMCWDYFAAKLEAENITNPNTDVIGAVSAFQRARNLRRNATEGASDEFRIACAPLGSDERAVLRGLIGRVGAVAGRVGLGIPVVPGL